MSEDSNRCLLERARHGDSEARERLFNENVGLVRMVLREFPSRVGTLTGEDLEQEGFLGLLRAIDKDGGSARSNFSTYAATTIRNHVDNAVRDQSRNVRLPKNQQDSRRRIVDTDLLYEIDLVTDDSSFEDRIDEELSKRSGRRVPPHPGCE